MRRWAATLGVLSVWTLGFTRQATAQHDSAAVQDSSLREQLEQLDQRVRILARLLELKQDSAAAAAKQQGRVTASREGFTIRSADGDFQLKVRGYIQADGRFFGGGAPALGTSTFFLRRVRPLTEATVWRYFGIRLMPDFGQGKVTLFDAYLDVRLAPQLDIRAGKTKPPVGIERVQSATDIRFAERALPTNLVPNRDVGLQLLGDFGGGALSYAVGVFNGVPDLGNLDGDATNDKDLVARLFAQPFVGSKGNPLKGLGFGISATNGIERGTVAATSLPAYVTPGQQTLFRYRDSTIANGRRYRVSPQAYFYLGPLGVLSEYVVSSQVVSRPTITGREIRNNSWQVAGSAYLTGEKASFTTVTPRHPFNPGGGAWGALEIEARYSELKLDSNAFPTFASATNSVRTAKAWAAGVTWHFARAVQLAVNYETTTFTGGATAGDRAPEHFLVTRLQEAF